MRRIILDVMMLAIFLTMMSFQFVPKLWHEVLGVALPLALLLHLVWNRRWLGALLRGKWSVRRVLPTAINFLLILSMAAVAVTGICLSNHLFKGLIPLELARNITVHQIHVSLPFLMIVLLGLHLGLHWKSWWQRLKTFCGWQGDSLHYRLLTKGMVLSISIIGIYGSIQNRVGDHLLMKHIFATPATNEPGGVYVLLILAVLGLYAVLAYGWQEWSERRNN